MSFKLVSILVKGVDYGITIGIKLEKTGIVWFDLVVMK